LRSKRKERKGKEKKPLQEMDLHKGQQSREVVKRSKREEKKPLQEVF